MRTTMRKNTKRGSTTYKQTQSGGEKTRVGVMRKRKKRRNGGLKKTKNINT
jgi:hypothetical protein